MPRGKCRDSYRPRPCPSFVQNLYHGISPSLRYFPLVPHPFDHPVKLPEHGRVVVYHEFEEFNREFVWSHCLRICHRPQGPNQLVFCRFDLEGVCDKPLGELFDDVEFELIGFRVEKSSEEPRPPSEDKPWISQHYALFITDVLRVNLPRVLYVQVLAALVEPPLVALAQILLHTLDVSFKEPVVGIDTDPVDARISRRTALISCLSWVSALCRFQAACLTAVAMLISVSAWASPLHPRPGSLVARGGTTRSAVCSMAVVKAVSTSSTLRQPSSF